ncbi:magnesium/cobalt transporter CorA [Varunaivibrio sulfuroxidans]|uniref:Magnesium transport protein CorA n=1 Tax=Varunaivibrio sulfuroxidans TaxID=1773489 RepID=A0A4R3J5J3_9PROT|nr:magnesium/cobalt transporter CorA [Varunaivibrio sulfuroxidans]TCS60552.1 magnesium transporter [Varunaivibrio sulfuroxidans]WES30042.1 magnesium/cobalt transporter CorA [Varunaivibrio sulfuroxidans]
MIRGYVNDRGHLRAADDPLKEIDDVIWADLTNPSGEEKGALEARIGIGIPALEEMEEIEISSRLYYEDGAAFMTATLPAQTDNDTPKMSPVTFVLAGKRLITVRYHDPRAFQTFPLRAARVAMGCTNGENTLIALLEAIIDRLADILERAGRDIDQISRVVFQHNGNNPTKSRDFQKVLEDIGLKGDLTSNIRDSLMTLERLIGFLGQVTTQRKSDKDIRARHKTLSRDAHSLTDHASFLSQKITFLLDATLGMINIEQNAIIKIFSVAAVVFLPPTLIASIYGMNFAFIPELKWHFGYPLSLVLMVVSAILPFWYFKRRGWL